MHDKCGCNPDTYMKIKAYLVQSIYLERQECPMKKPALLCLALILLTLLTPVYASVELTAVIGQDIDVTLDLRHLNTTLYQALKDQLQNNATKIPEIIRENLMDQNLTRVEYRLEPVAFDDAAKAITIRFQLSGSDIVTITFSEEAIRRIYHVKTEWRKFELAITSEFSLSFTEYFDEPLSEWSFENETYPTYYYNCTDTAAVDPVCYFILPAEATAIRIEGETIVFELNHTSLGEALLNSPFLILGAIMIAVLISSLYGTISKREDLTEDSPPR